MNATTKTAPTVTVREIPAESTRSWTYRDTVWRNGGPRTVYRANRRSSELPDGRSIVYLDFVGETVFDNLLNRHSRPHTVLKPLVEQALRDAGFEFTKLRWSQTAGCSCPCSPGFLVHGGKRGLDIWVTVS